MRNVFAALSILLALAFPSTPALQPERPRGRAFSVRLPQDIDTAGLSIRYLLTGTFGAYSGFVRTRPGVRDYRIDTFYEGRPAETLKVAVYCPGYGVETFNVPDLSATAERTAEVRLKPLATLPLSGRVLLPLGTAPRGLRLEVSFEPFWECEFFGLSDCLTAGHMVASGELDGAGGFSVEVPDFARDPLAGTFKRRGEFTLRLTERRGGKALFRLRPERGPLQAGGIPVGAVYAKGQVFIAERER
jgi:hypothetical protein